MKFLFLLGIALCQSLSALCQRYQPDFSKDYPFPDNSTPFVFQKKTLPSPYRVNAAPAGGEQVPEVEVLEVTQSDTTKETFLERLYRKRLRGYHEVFFSNGKQGIKNEKGEILIPAIYDRLDVFGWVVLARQNNKYGILNGKGETVLPFEWRFHEMSHGLILLSNGKRAVVYTEEMKTVLDKPAIEADFMYSYEEVLNLYKLKDEKGWQVYDRNAIHLLDGYFSDFTHFTKDLFALCDGAGWWLFSLGGKKLSEEPYKKIEPFSYEHLDVFVVRKDSLLSRKYFLLNASGRVISDAFDNISTPYHADPDQDWVKVTNGTKRGIINYQGKWVVPAEYDKIEDGYNGYYKLWKGDKVVRWVSIKTGKLYNQMPNGE